MNSVKMEIDEYGDAFYVKNINLRLRCESYEIKNLKNIENDILEVINDKAFDGICSFELIGDDNDN